MRNLLFTIFLLLPLLTFGQSIEGEVSRLKQKIEDQQREINRLKEKNDRLSSDLKDFMENFKREKANNELSKLESRINNLEKSVSKLKGEGWNDPPSMSEINGEIQKIQGSGYKYKSPSPSLDGLDERIKKLELKLK